MSLEQLDFDFITSADKWQVINESEDGKPLPKGILMVLEGPIGLIEEKNNNKRLYEADFWPYILSLPETKLMFEKRLFLGEFGHPPVPYARLEKISHVLTKAWIKGEELWGRIEVYNSIMGRQLKLLIDTGSQFGVSTRARGEVLPTARGLLVDKKRYKWAGIDFVINPSATNAFPIPVEEQNDEASLVLINEATSYQDYKKEFDEEGKPVANESTTEDSIPSLKQEIDTLIDENTRLKDENTRLVESVNLTFGDEEKERIEFLNAMREKELVDRQNSSKIDESVVSWHVKKPTAGKPLALSHPHKKAMELRKKHGGSVKVHGHSKDWFTVCVSFKDKETADKFREELKSLEGDDLTTSLPSKVNEDIESFETMLLESEDSSIIESLRQSVTEKTEDLLRMKSALEDSVNEETGLSRKVQELAASLRREMETYEKMLASLRKQIDDVRSLSAKHIRESEEATEALNKLHAEELSSLKSVNEASSLQLNAQIKTLNESIDTLKLSSQADIQKTIKELNEAHQTDLEDVSSNIRADLEKAQSKISELNAIVARQRVSIISSTYNLNEEQVLKDASDLSEETIRATCEKLAHGTQESRTPFGETKVTLRLDEATSPSQKEAKPKSNSWVTSKRI